ncbi:MULTISPECIES: hypothetical protein [Virgibacillus]|uniref:Uncharacterized protein n=1 Tax=Virgibacillus pantothenticus TaxID=1473 RepID=A0A0L0QLC2_VIRPA|nr:MULTISPECIES: hypothetical protein [Virgibacillus]API92720.1 hypothetical protein BKP57_13430 [Virgibacillus sp. 6R]KNE19038.1 hypothetical protein AFK71_10770 [Virgibacillus pantothenticus]MBS7428216.1 hypothetical protein [Virgibacillus sp. 19R1-5]MED3738982.1 hypothetical protein [Virgibacillus pantothenticus]QTY15477.1 hypothetical protein KBP50_16530 [Virgibacillus pantothenticus]
MSDEDFSFVKQKEFIDDLFADLLKRYTLPEIYEMDILELLRLTNKKTTKKKESKKTDSLFAAFGK